MPKEIRAKQISNVDEYLALFPQEHREKLLKNALDIRKFEIEMYWKRTAFFWAFIVSIYTAFFFLLTKQNNDEYAIFLVLLSFLAIIFSIAWVFVNKGSKFWQENWEQHVSLLENEPLYDVFLNPKESGSWYKPFKEYDFSVSKINLFLSFVVSISSFLVFVFSLVHFFHFGSEWQKMLFIFILSVVLSVWGFTQCVGHKKMKIIKDNEKSPFMPMIYVQRGKNENQL